MSEPLHIVVRCAEPLQRKVRYVFDTLLMARGVPVVYSSHPPQAGPWLFYGPGGELTFPLDRCLTVAHCPAAWEFLERGGNLRSRVPSDGLATVIPETVGGVGQACDVSFDIVASGFYFLSSWSERGQEDAGQSRRTYAGSVFARLGVPQDIVDQYLGRLMGCIDALCDRLNHPRWTPPCWPQGARFAVVLSHDVDFLPHGLLDVARQGARTVMRHLIRQRDPGDALRATAGLVRAVADGRDPYGCIPHIIEREQALGVRSSFQVAVGHRHPDDVNYYIEDDGIRDYLRAIPDSGFDLCLHGSYRSTEDPEWYAEEVALLTERLGRPLGSRQHFLSFDYDTLFLTQERCGIQYDMSLGFPDRLGPRAGFSYPFFPYCLKEDRPYKVLQIGLHLMDVTLRGYMGLKGARAWEAIKAVLDDLCLKRGCVSVVWHPIVFGGARDPGYDRLYWDLVDYVRGAGGLATDGRTVNSYWRGRARAYPSFASLCRD